MPSRRPPYLLRLRVRNYRSLRDVDVPLGPLNVLIGPNGAGRSTLLDVVGFLAHSARLDLESAVDRRGGYDSLRFRDASRHPWISIVVEAVASKHASLSSPDTYSVRFRSAAGRGGGSSFDVLMAREEELTFGGRAAGSTASLSGAPTSRSGRCQPGWVSLRGRSLSRLVG